jgi:hypothetical protein
MMSDVQSLFQPNVTSAGLTAQVTPFGTYYNDPRPQRFLAIIRGPSGSGTGSGASGSGSIDAGAIPADDQSNAYDWEEAYWTVLDDDFVCIKKPLGRYGTVDRLPAMEVNGASDVQDGIIVELIPGFGQPDFYYFFAPAEQFSGSGNMLTIVCPDGTTTQVQVGNGPPNTGGDPGGGTSGSPIQDPTGGGTPIGGTGGGGGGGGIGSGGGS